MSQRVSMQSKSPIIKQTAWNIDPNVPGVNTSNSAGAGGLQVPCPWWPFSGKFLLLGKGIPCVVGIKRTPII